MLVGKLITFEGIDGAGKSTQIQLLETEFNKLGILYKTFREPGGTDLSEKIREILLDKDNLELYSNAESLLFAAARAQLTIEQIKPAIAKGECVICDRFTDSTIAYQGHGRGLNIKNLEIINNIATEGLTPDITFILDIDPGKASERMRAESPDRMEAAGIDFFQKIRQGYHQIMEQFPYRCIVINAEQSQENISKEINQIIMKRFKEELTCS
ncbi:dTMP kinase [Candidatus Marinimicrobia bacterium PRS2]|nr:dTMP kinase [Candidatus Marinimicrobia bacterium PRS2]